MFSLTLARTNCYKDSRIAGDLSQHDAQVTSLWDDCGCPLAAIVQNAKFKKLFKFPQNLFGYKWFKINFVDIIENCPKDIVQSSESHLLLIYMYIISHMKWEYVQTMKISELWKTKQNIFFIWTTLLGSFLEFPWGTRYYRAHLNDWPSAYALRRVWMRLKGGKIYNVL